MIKVILLVDDDETLLSIESEALSGFDYRIIPCSSGFQALEEFSNNRDIDLIITDRHMKDVSGDELISQISKHDRPVPVILTSGSFLEKDCCDAETRDQTFLLPKPYRISRLVELIKDIEKKTS